MLDIIEYQGRIKASWGLKPAYEMGPCQLSPTYLPTSCRDERTNLTNGREDKTFFRFNNLTFFTLLL